MVSTNIATATQNNILRARILEIQNEMMRAQNQVSTGKKTDVYSGLRTEARTSISLNNSKATVETYKQTISMTKARMDTMEAVYKRISDIVVEVRNTTLQVIGAEATATGSASATLKSLAENRLAEIVNLLNSAVDGRHLFGGIALSTPPMIDPGSVGTAGTPLDNVAAGAPALANTDLSGAERYVAIAGAKDATTGAVLAGNTVIPVAGPPAGVQAGMQVTFEGHATAYTIASVGPGNQITLAAPLTAGVANGEEVRFVGMVDENDPTFYYQGDLAGAQISARIDNSFDLEYGVRGDDPAFATIMGALYALATSDLTTTTDAGYRRLGRLAMNDLDAGFDQLQEHLGLLGVKQSTLEQTESRHTDFLIVLQQQIVNVEDVDPADAISRFTLLQSNLEASFRLLSSTRDLSLVNFL